MAIDIDITPRMYIEHSIDMDVIEQFGKIMGGSAALGSTL